LLDEPAVGLDAGSIERFGVLLARHRAQGGMVIAATHQALPLQDAKELPLAPYTPPPLAGGGQGEGEALRQ
jgi:heme exporter protein A